MLTIKVAGKTHEITASSPQEGVTTFEVPGPVSCDGCGEDLGDGPCRAGEVVCYWCGRRYPVAQVPVLATASA